MLEVLFSSKKAERHLWEVFVIAVFYSSISILVSFWIFPEYASLISVFFTVASCLYVTQRAIKREELKEQFLDEVSLIKEHAKPLKLFLAIFIGVVISFSFWVSVLPSDRVDLMFSVQKSVLEGIRGQVSGNAVARGDMFNIIFNNNLKVLFVSFLVSLIYGAGAIFVLTWNASIMGYVIGVIVKNNGVISYPVAMVKYFLHGIPEMISYFVVILAGGMMYFSVVKGDFSNTNRVKKTFKDVFLLLGLAFLIMSFAAAIEVWVSPLI